MKEITLYTVIPQIPKRLSPLKEMAKNLWFSWNLEAIDLFRSIDSQLWEETQHNPLALLSRLSQERYNELLEDEGFLSEMDRVYNEFTRYLGEEKSYHFGLKGPLNFIVAYFSAEYGLTDCLPIYSGGLGILAGDHLKSASDLRVNLVGIGLLYQKGYFRQYLNNNGWQLERYMDNDFHILPVELLKNENGYPFTIELPIESRNVKVRVWKIRVGRVSLFLLDTNTIENEERDRDITSSLYGGDHKRRLEQEMILGIGGVRVLESLGIQPSVFHMNEGHSAFAIIERIRILMEREGLSFEEAKEAVYMSNVFTTHTPVPAGIDVFQKDLIDLVMGSYLQQFGLNLEQFMSLGIVEKEGSDSLNMAVMAIKNSVYVNGVSRLHQSVSRKMWAGIWPLIPEPDLPIDCVTNGIHIPSWISGDLAVLFDRYLGKRWAEDPDNQKIWDRINAIPDSELWRTHERRRERLVSVARKRLEEQLIQKGAKRMEIQMAKEALHPGALTIGFARRFATYKRGDLILKDPSRLAKILNDPQRPVQIIFAGKAHPKDHPGKEIIKNIFHFTQQPEFRHRIIFIEDYDLNVARYLVQGVDVWLNTPLRPMEACGTSGMKAAANGALNLSVLDGWWAEGYRPDLGWAIGEGEEYEDIDYQATVESQAIYHLLETTIVPLFYERGKDNLPRDWIRMMKRSMQILAAYFNSNRMLEDYVNKFYLPLSILWTKIQEDRWNPIRQFILWKNYIRSNWHKLRILDKKIEPQKEIERGKTLKIEVQMELGDISPEDISVEAYYGPVDSKANLLERFIIRLAHFARDGGKVLYQGEIPCERVGRFGLKIRVIPSHPLLINPYSLNLILWG